MPSPAQEPPASAAARPTLSAMHLVQVTCGIPTASCHLMRRALQEEASTRRSAAHSAPPPCCSSACYDSLDRLAAGLLCGTLLWLLCWPYPLAELPQRASQKQKQPITASVADGSSNGRCDCWGCWLHCCLLQLAAHGLVLGPMGAEAAAAAVPGGTKMTTQLPLRIIPDPGRHTTAVIPCLAATPTKFNTAP